MSLKSPRCALRNYDKYSKLLSKGMPDDFVKRKMIFDGIKQREVDNFFSNLETHSSYTCYSDKPVHFRNSASSKYLSSKNDRHSLSVKSRKIDNTTRNRSYSTFYTVKNVGSFDVFHEEDTEKVRELTHFCMLFCALTTQMNIILRWQKIMKLIMI